MQHIKTHQWTHSQSQTDRETFKNTAANKQYDKPHMAINHYVFSGEGRQALTLHTSPGNR